MSRTPEDINAEIQRLGLTPTGPVTQQPASDPDDDIVRLQTEIDRLLAPEANESALPFEQPEPVFKENEGPSVVFDIPAELDPLIPRAAKAGIIFDQPVQDGHASASFGFDFRARFNAFRQANPDTLFRIGPETSEGGNRQIEYFNEKEKRWALADPPGQFAEGIPGLSGGTVEITPEILGGGAALFLTKSPWAVQAGNTLGAFMGRLGRHMIGDAIGINNHVPAEEMIKDAMDHAEIVLATGVIGEKIFQFGRLIVHAVRGEAIPEAVVRAIGATEKEAEELALAVNKKLGSERLRFSLAQSSGDEWLLSLMETYRKTPELAKEYGQFDAAQQTALSDFWAALSYSRSRLSKADLANRTVAIGDARVEREILPAKTALQLADAQRVAAVDAIPNQPWGTLGESIRIVGTREQQAFRDEAKRNFLLLNQAMGNAKAVKPTETAKFIHEVQGQNALILIDALRKRREALVGRARAPGSQALNVEKTMLGGDNADIVLSIDQAEANLMRLANPDAKLTVEEVWQTASALKELVRESASGQTTDIPAVGIAKGLIQKLEKDLKTTMQGSPLRAEYDELMTWYSTRIRSLESGAVDELLKRKGGPNGEWVVRDSEMFGRITRDVAASRQVRRLMGSNIGVVQGMRNAILADYRSKVINQVDGTINLGAHEAYVGRPGDARDEILRVWFNKAGMRELRKPGGMQKAVNGAQLELTKVENAIRGTLKDRMSRLEDAGQLRGLLINKDNPEQAARVMEIVGKNPDVKFGIRTMYRDWIRQKIEMKGQKIPGLNPLRPMLSPAQLNKLVTEHGENIAAVMGKEYADNLEILSKSLERAARETKLKNFSNTSTAAFKSLKDMSRIYVGMFTAKGRAMTAVDRLRFRAMDRIMFDAITNPKRLDELLQAAAEGKQNRQLINFLLGGGASVLDSGYFEEETGAAAAAITRQITTGEGVLGP